MSLMVLPVFRGKWEMSKDVKQEEQVPQRSGSSTMTVSFTIAVSVTPVGIIYTTMYITPSSCVKHKCTYYNYLSAAMVIGFTLRSQTVSESQASSFMHSFIVNVEVTSQRISEIDYEIPLRHIDSAGDATLEHSPTTTEYDALFGFGNPLTQTQVLSAGNLQITTSTTIIDDLHVEREECFTLRAVVSVARPGLHMSFMCNEFNNPVDFFCLHTICIEDDDG